MASPTYDSAIIKEFASRLYSQANSIIVTYTVVGAILGVAAGLGAGATMGDANIVAFSGAIVLGGIGFAIGRGAAFKLKLAAQSALCQVAIEENTRPR